NTLLEIIQITFYIQDAIQKSSYHVLIVFPRILIETWIQLGLLVINGYCTIW
ncbi:3677_t:CDS:1, partial [Racocetra fulgida]